jgi:hypothetical protein
MTTDQGQALFLVFRGLPLAEENWSTNLWLDCHWQTHCGVSSGCFDALDRC